MIYGGVDMDHNQRIESNKYIAVQGNIKNQSENILRTKEMPLDILLRKVIDNQGNDQTSPNEEDKGRYKKGHMRI